jgi:hypothetical protein
VNRSTYNRRAKAQSLNNLKELNPHLIDIVNSNVSVKNAEEFTKQRDLQQRASQLQKSIDKLIDANSSMGLTVQDDGAGNNIVVDQQAIRSDQNERLQQLYSDNTVRFRLQPEPADPNAPAGKDAPADTKGNLNRANLKGHNLARVQELAVEQQKKAGGQQAQERGAQDEAPSKTRSYAFEQAVNAPGGQPGLGQGRSGKPQAMSGITRQFGTGATLGDARSEGRGYTRIAGPVGRNPIAAGGMGGMGGARDRVMAGMGAGGGAAPQEGAQLAQPVPVWTTSGGLSLLIDIPTDGKVYSFSKVSGAARLTLGVRPHQTWQLALGLVWTAIWIVILALIAYALRHRSAVALLRR